MAPKIAVPCPIPVIAAVTGYMSIAMGQLYFASAAQNSLHQVRLRPVRRIATPLFISVLL